MEKWQLQHLHDFINGTIQPQYGPQPRHFKKWNKRALRSLYVEYLRPQYRLLRKNPDFQRVVEEVQRALIAFH